MNPSMITLADEIAQIM